MQPISILRFALGSILFLSPAYTFSAETNEPLIAEKPEYEEGDQWRFRIKQSGFQTYDSTRAEGVYEIVYEDRLFHVFQIVNDKRISVYTRKESASNDPVRLFGMGLTGLGREWAYDFPLFVGKNWTRTYKTSVLSDYGTQSLSIKADIRVESVKKATTEADVCPVGLQIVRNDTSGWGPFLRFVSVFCPATKSHSSLEMKSFSNESKTEIELLSFFSRRKTSLRRTPSMSATSNPVSHRLPDFMFALIP